MAKSFRGQDLTGYSSPMDRAKLRGHDKELGDGERAHSGQPGAKVRHGADANNQVVRRSQFYDKKMRPVESEHPGWPPGTSKWAE